jgi:hypothetical protein
LCILPSQIQVTKLYDGRSALEISVFFMAMMDSVDVEVSTDFFDVVGRGKEVA